MHGPPGDDRITWPPKYTAVDTEISCCGKVPCHDRLTAGSHERRVFTADDRMNTDNDLPPLSNQTVDEHLQFDDTDPGRGELSFD